jgi:hypothetical protein
LYLVGKVCFDSEICVVVVCQTTCCHIQEHNTKIRVAYLVCHMLSWKRKNKDTTLRTIPAINANWETVSSIHAYCWWFFCDLFNDTLSSSDYMSNDALIGEKRNWDVFWNSQSLAKFRNSPRIFTRKLTNITKIFSQESCVIVGLWVRDIPMRIPVMFIRSECSMPSCIASGTNEYILIKFNI